MKKIFSSISAAILLGSTSMSFAATNPFTDVPAGHWAYNSVAKLASEGVIEGYGDKTYRGERNITRYEMAQMVAKAMAKYPTGANKAELDRLAAEFRDELDALGVRVSEIEKHADKVVWHGELRYTYTSQRLENADGSKSKTNNDVLLLRLEPKMEINDHWNIHARIDSTLRLYNDSNDTLHLQRAWAQGNYDNFSVKIGRIPDLTNYDKNLMFFTQFSGAEINFGKVLKTQIRAGRFSKANLMYDESLRRAVGRTAGDDPASFQSIALTYSPSKFSLTGAYYHFKSDLFKDTFYSKRANEDNAHIWEIAASYRFDKNFALTGAYMKNTKADYYDKSYLAHLDYKGSKKAEQGSWGAYVSYRYQGGNTSMYPSTDGAFQNTKGWELGAQYTVFSNIQAKLIYFKGKQLENNRDAEKLFGRVEFWF